MQDDDFLQRDDDLINDLDDDLFAEVEKNIASQTKSKERGPKHFGAFIRNGERLEEQIEKSPNVWDIPMTALGLKQAKRTGEFLKEYFDKNEYKFD